MAARGTRVRRLRRRRSVSPQRKRLNPQLTHTYFNHSESRPPGLTTVYLVLPPNASSTRTSHLRLHTSTSSQRRSGLSSCRLEGLTGLWCPGAERRGVRSFVASRGALKLSAITLMPPRRRSALQKREIRGLFLATKADFRCTRSWRCARRQRRSGRPRHDQTYWHRRRAEIQLLAAFVCQPITGGTEQ